MTYIITERCIPVKDRSCVEVCPVDCIYEYVETLGGFVVPDPATGPGTDKTVIPRGDVVHVPSPDVSRPQLTAQLFIHPDECIDCGACESVCPVTAILPEGAVPAESRASILLQYVVFGLTPP